MAKEEKQLLSREEVDIVLEFAQALYGYNQYGFFSPELANSLLQRLNNTATQPTADSIRDALSNYQENAENLQNYMDFVQFYDMIFARTLKSYVNALSFDLQIVCTNAYTSSDYESDEYVADYKRVYDFLNKFRYKDEFRKIVQQLMLREVYYIWFRKVKWGNKENMKYAIQILPQQYCMLTGYWEKGMLFDFNMQYFLQAGVDIDGFDPAFKKYYKRVFGEGASEMKNYIPTNPLRDRSGTYSMWTQTSPNDGAWVFKFSPDNFNCTPFLAPLLKSAITDDEIQQLQYNKDIAEAFGILAGEIPLFDNAKSGTQPDQMAFNPKTLGGFMAKAKSGLGSTIKLAALPIKGIDFYQFEDKNDDMYSTQLQTTASTGTGISRVIYSTDRMSNAEVDAALNEVYQTMKPLYYQFGNFLDFYVNKITKKYKFRFVFDGSTYTNEKEARFDKLMKLADKGIVLSSSAFASAIGIEPQVFDAMLQESKFSGWLDKYSQLMLNVNTTAGGESIGRPKSEGIVDDSTERNYDM